MTPGSGNRRVLGAGWSRAEQSLRRAHRSLRKEPMNKLARRLAGSSRVPFEVRSRSLWRTRQWTWIARRPVSVPEKIRWKMLKDRRPLLTTFADKVAVRDYVAGVVGPAHLTACYAIVADPDELERDALPAEFVAKANHGSGGSWFVSETAPAGITIHGERPDLHPATPGAGWNRVLTRPEELDWGLLRETLRAWLELDYTEHYVEWAYRNIRPRLVIVEELLRGDDGGVPPDYKFWVCDGRVRLVQVEAGRFGDNRARAFYSPDWNRLEVRYAGEPSEGELPAPAALAEMVRIAEALGRETDFVRVDLYAVGERVLFGELTNYPDAGTAAFTPDEFDLELARTWTIPRSYRTLPQGGPVRRSR
jgi:hypothetical protein